MEIPFVLDPAEYPRLGETMQEPPYYVHVDAMSDGMHTSAMYPPPALGVDVCDVSMSEQRMAVDESFTFGPSVVPGKCTDSDVDLRSNQIHV